MSEHREPIPSMIYNSAVGGHVTNSQQIIDEDYNIEQKDINKEVLGLPYNSTNPNGMGRIVLKKTDNFKEVVEAQTNGNTIFVIKYDFVLTDNVTIPANCVLEFDGGSIANGSGNSYTVQGHFSIADCHQQIFNGVSFEKDKTYLGVDFIRPEWFGAKGNYDYTSGTGTNDSAAISLAILNANYAKVNKVKFSAVTYYIGSQIDITNGDVMLEGVYATEREEDVFNYATNEITAERNSCLLTDQDISIIVAGSDVSHPIHLKHLNFKSTNAYTGKAFQFSSAFSGPTWPVIVDGCRFHNFWNAIYIFSPNLDYCLHTLIIKNCSFWECAYCLNVWSGNRISYLGFFYNNCHQNARGIVFYLRKVGCDIHHNNFETNRTVTGVSEDAIVTIYNAGNGCINFNNNYFETNSVAELRVENISTLQAIISIEQNYCANTAQNKVYIKGSQYIVKCDVPLYAEGGPIYFDKLPEYLILTGTAYIAFNEFSNIDRGNGFDHSLLYKGISYRSGNINPANIKMINGVTTFKTSANEWIDSFQCDAGKCYLACIIDFLKEYETQVEAAGCTNNTDEISVFSVQRFVNRRYSATFVYAENGITQNSWQRLYIRQNSFIGPVLCGQKLVDSNLLDVNSVIEDMTPHNIIASASRLTDISKASIGDKCLLFDSKKEVSFDGTNWYYVDGTSI